MKDSSTSRRRVVFFGDSLTQGTGVMPHESFPAIINQKIREKGWNLEVRNEGISGDTSSAGLERIRQVLRLRPHLFVIALGANDGLQGLPTDQTRHNLQRIIDICQAELPEAKIALAGLDVPRKFVEMHSARFSEHPSADVTRYLESFHELFPELAERNSLLFIPSLLERVVGNTTMNQPDGMHPNAEGHRKIAENVWRTLEPYLAEMGSEVGQAE